MSQDNFIRDVVERLADNRRVRRELPFGGRLNIDRQLPFICVYREPVTGSDAGTGSLIQGEASFVTTTASRKANRGVSSLVTAIATVMSEQFGSFLIVEVWSAPDRDVAVAAEVDC